MFFYELLSAGYFVVLAAAVPFTGAPRGRAAAVALASLAAAGAIVAISTAPFAVRAWLPHLYIAFAYWLPALATTRRPGTFEAWLVRTEAAWPTTRVPPAVLYACEVAYLCCYPLVPVALGLVMFRGDTDDVLRFWTAVLSAGYASYVSLPWLVSRPPRLIEALPPVSGAGRINRALLARVSHQLTTFPSGHVAVSVALAFEVWSVWPAAGVAVGIIAAVITVGSVAGRYHYAIDAALGIAVGSAAAAIA